MIKTKVVLFTIFSVVLLADVEVSGDAEKSLNETATALYAEGKYKETVQLLVKKTKQILVTQKDLLPHFYFLGYCQRAQTITSEMARLPWGMHANITFIQYGLFFRVSLMAILSGNLIFLFLGLRLRVHTQS